MIFFSNFIAGRLIPRVLERRREREERETRDESNPDDQVVEENEDSGNRNIDVDVPSPRNVAQTHSGRSQNEEDSIEAQEQSENNDSREDMEDQ